MPRAEVGSTKHLANKIKSKGLQRLRWFCTPCNKQCRDENGFTCHIASESHVRQMQVVGEDPKKFINLFSAQFQRDFLMLLRTSHGEKSISANRFYNEYISNKEHVHMNSTKWKTLTEFVKYLGREGICRVEDSENDSLKIAWIDNSPEALRRQDAIRKKERQDKGDEEREQKLIRQQIEKAQEAERARKGHQGQEEADAEARRLERGDGQKIKLSFAKSGPTKPLSPPDSQVAETPKDESPTTEITDKPQIATPPVEEASTPAIKMSFGSAAPKQKNVFAAAKKNPLAGKKIATKEQPKKISEVERIMKEEMSRKRPANDMGVDAKRQRVA